MADKYLYNNAGTPTERAATTASAGAADAGKIPGLDAAGRLDNSMMPVGLGADTSVVTASEALAAGDFVNIWNNTGAKARKADATTASKEAHGFVLASVANGAAATVYFEGSNTQVTGQTAGNVFLSTTPGLATSTAPSAAGNAVQRIGVATSATNINTEFQTPIILA